jgi:hypothetical protein
MSTDCAPGSRRLRNYFVLVYVRIRFVPFIIFLPLRCFAEIIEGLSDLLCLFKRTKAGQFMATLEDIQTQIRTFGPLDLADVNVSSRGTRVRVRLLVR